MQQQILDYLEASEHRQFHLLKKLVLQPSHTSYKKGVDQVGLLLRQALADCPLKCTMHHSQVCGDNLVFHSAACATRGQRPLVLVGHMDTVFPLESSFNFYREDEINAYGPGVCDMKGGLVTAVFLLKALNSQRLLEEIPIVLICNSDEETGSRHSGDLIRSYARQALCGLVFECGGTQGEVVTGRKGKSGYHLDIFGKSGHAAFTKELGKTSAVLELAHKTIQLEQLNDPEKEIVVNVGLVTGGSAANVVAERAAAEIDARYLTAEDALFCRKRIEGIASRATVEGTISTVSATHGRIPMMQTEDNMALYRLFKKQADFLGLPLQPELRSGVSDANTLAECNIPVIDGLGPIGGLDHSADEYMVKASLVQRCKLAALTVIDIWEHQRQGLLPPFASAEGPDKA